MAALGDTAYAVHHVRPGIGRLLFSDELAAFTRNISTLRAPAQAFLFFGDSYGELLTELERGGEPDAGRLIGYGEAYRRLRLPAHLLTCDDAGALAASRHGPAQLPGGTDPHCFEVEIRPRRRKTFPSATLCSAARLFSWPRIWTCGASTPPLTPPGRGGTAPSCWPLWRRRPRLSCTRGYRDTGKARVFTLTDAALQEFLGGEGEGCDPSQLPFTTEKGEVIHAPLIKAR